MVFNAAGATLYTGDAALCVIPVALPLRVALALVVAAVLNAVGFGVMPWLGVTGGVVSFLAG